MARIRDSAVTINSVATASMVCEMPTHQSGDLLVAFVAKDLAAAFTTPASWSAVQTVISAGAGGGVYTKRAASSSETVTFALTSAPCCALVVAVQGVFGTTATDGISASGNTVADDTTLPFASASCTPTHNGCLVMSGLITDSGIGPFAQAGWVNAFAGDTGANSLCVSYTLQGTAGAIAGPSHWAAAADDTRAVIIALRDDGTSNLRETYVSRSTVPATLLMPMVGATAGDAGTWVAAASITHTSLGGKTVTGVAVAAAADSGYNPFHAAARSAGSSSTTNLAHTEFTPTAAYNLTTGSGVLFGTWRPQVPRDYIDMGSAVRGGVYVDLAGATPNTTYSAWVVGAQFSATTDPSNRQNFAIQVAQTSDTRFANAGTVTLTSVPRVAFGSSGYYGACSIEWSQLVMLNETVTLGGTSANPIDFDRFVNAVNRGSGDIPVLVRAGAAVTCWTRLRFGGEDSTHVSFDLQTFQYPRKADEIDYLDFHVDNNHLGFEFYGLAGDSLRFTNCVFTSDSPYYWRFNASHSGSATLNFAGSTVVRATVTLRSTVTLNRTTFVSCPSFTQNAATLTSCSFSSSPVTSDNPTLISAATFTSAGTGHGLIITTPGTYTLTNDTFTGFAGTDGSTGNEAIYNNSGGAVTLNIVGGTTPSVRNGAGASTSLIVNPVTTSLTVRDQISNAAIQSARALLLAADNTGPLPYNVTVTVAGSTENAVVFDAYADRLIGSNVPSSDTNYTMSCWVRLDSAPLASFTSVPLALTRGSGGDYAHTISINENLQMSIIDNLGGTVVRTLALGTWYYLAHTVSGGTTTLFSRAANEASFSSGTKTTVTGPWTPTQLNISGWDVFGTAVRGRMAHVRIWNRVLTTTELLAESLSRTPVSSTNLLGAWALAGSAARATAINGSALTDASTGPWGTDLGPITLATVTHNSHNVSTGQKMLIKGANEIEYNGVKAVTVVNANSYTYPAIGATVTPATGTIKSTGVVLEGVTDASGVLSEVRSWSASQPVTGRIRRATTGTLYRTGTVTGTVSNTSGFSATVLLIRDE